MLTRLRHALASKFRTAAFLLDGEGYIRDRFHRVNVESMNRYISQVEWYIVELEDLLDEQVVERLRKRHRRTDNRRCLEAGAWGSGPEIGDPPPYRRGET